METFVSIFDKLIDFLSGEKNDIETSIFTTAIFLEWILRYGLIAGGFWLLLYVFKIPILIRFKVDPRMPEKKQIVKEVLYSISSLVIYVMTSFLVLAMYRAGYNQMYVKVDDFGWVYFFFSLVVSIVLHDTYFYWTHRLIHMRRIFPYVHRVHHLSNNPSPWAAFSFHPWEAVISAIYVPILLIFLPMHVVAVLLFLLHMTLMNVLGHCGYELFRPNFATSKWAILYNSTTHHVMHHKRVTANYGLYFNFWDRLMKTNHPEYVQTYLDVTKQDELGNPVTESAAATQQPKH